MSKENYFELDVTEAVVSDFVRDHYESITCYAKGREYLEHLDLKGKMGEVSLTDSESKVLIDFYTQLCGLHSELEASFTNLHISYYAFKQAAQTNDAVRMEFNKLPAKYSDLQDTLNNLLAGYADAINALKKLM